MNKQYIGEVPLPYLLKSEVEELSRIYDDIQMELESYAGAYGEEIKNFERVIKSLQNEQNDFVYRKYNLSDSQIAMLKENVDLGSIDWFKNTVWG